LLLLPSPNLPLCLPTHTTLILYQTSKWVVLHSLLSSFCLLSLSLSLARERWQCDPRFQYCAWGRDKGHTVVSSQVRGWVRSKFQSSHKFASVLSLCGRQLLSICVPQLRFSA
jgi:hypothetical protein